MAYSNIGSTGSAPVTPPVGSKPTNVKVNSAKPGNYTKPVPSGTASVPVSPPVGRKPNNVKVNTNPAPVTKPQMRPVPNRAGLGRLRLGGGGMGGAGGLNINDMNK